ncbi:ATP-binding cassette domain-containing protein [Pediococcus parvulus]|uniref:ATP-binding cassette domain-containing protein n=1 Tax=Pediococcus parvulus TaxID=54062 RepID=UPI00345E4A5E
MNIREIFKLVPQNRYLWLVLSKLYMSGFNLFVSIMIQVGITIAFGKNIFQLWYVWAALIAGSVVYGIIYFNYSMLLEKTKKHVSETVSLKLMNNVISSSQRQEVKEGELVNLINQDAETIANYLYSGVSPLFDFFLSMLMGLCYVFFYSWISGVFYLCIGLTFFVLVRCFFEKQAHVRQIFENYDDEHKRFFAELYKNIPLLRIFGSTQWALTKHQYFFAKKFPYWTKNVNTAAINSSLFVGGVYFVEVSSLIGGLLLVKNNNLQLSVMVGIWNAGIGSILDPFMSLPGVISYLSQQHVAIKRVNNRMSVYQEDHNVIGSKADQAMNLEKILIRNLYFSYADDGEEIFKNLNLTIPRSKITFIVGDNGAGKTTIIKLILGLIEPTSGRIFALDTNNREQTGFSLKLAYVPQKNILFNTTIYRNLTLDKPIDLSTIKNVLEAVHMSHQIEQLSNGLNTVVGDETNFSEGQMRRLSIARAVLSNKQFVVMDEPFSDLDRENQTALMQELRSISKQTGILIITHTFDLIEPSDNVIRIGGLT